MASKSAVYKDYLIVQEDSGSIKLLRVYDNVKDSLRQIAKVVGFSYEDSWTTRQFGSKLVKEYGSNGVAQVGEYTSSKELERYKGHTEVRETLASGKRRTRQVKCIKVVEQNTYTCKYCGACYTTKRTKTLK